MSIEWITVILSAATLVVIAASALAAVIQLRHLRASNQLDALLEILEQWNDPSVLNAYSHFHTIDKKLDDPAYVTMLRTGRSHDRGSFPEFLVFDLWEQVGTYVKHRLIDETTFLDLASRQVLNAYRRGAPMVEILRTAGGPAVFENFEYLAARALLYERRYPDGSYPRSTPRMAQLEPVDPSPQPPSA